MRWYSTSGLSMVARVLHDLHQFGLLRAEAVPHGSSSGELGRSTLHCLVGSAAAASSLLLGSSVSVSCALAVIYKKEGARPAARTP